MHYLGDLAGSVTDFMATDITNTTITLSWSPPTALVPISYEIDHRCRRLCESSFGGIEEDTAVTSPHYSTDITPYTQCLFNLIGHYGADYTHLTTTYFSTTLFAGKVLLKQIVHHLFTQPLLYQSVTSQSLQWSQCQ